MYIDQPTGLVPSLPPDVTPELPLLLVALRHTAEVGSFVETMAGFVRWSLGNPLSYLMLLFAIGAAAALGPVLARRLSWDLPGTRLAIVGLGIAVVPTVVVRIGHRPMIWDPSAVISCGTGIVQPWTDPLEVLNLLLLVPFAAGLTWASRNLWLATLGTIALAAALEPVQAATGLGQCDAEDTLRYLLGGATAVAAAYAATRARRRSSVGAAEPAQKPSRI